MAQLRQVNHQFFYHCPRDKTALLLILIPLFCRIRVHMSALDMTDERWIGER